MIGEIDLAILKQRHSFLVRRGETRLGSATLDTYSSIVAATLFRDAAATALIIGSIEEARKLLQRSGELIISAGLAGGLQLVFLAGKLFDDDGSPDRALNDFAREFGDRLQRGERRTDHGGPTFNDESFRPPHLLRVFQALVGANSTGKHREFLEAEIGALLALNGTMPVGTTRTPLRTYLRAYDDIAQATSSATGGALEDALRAFAHRRQEVLDAAAEDTFHWKLLLRPADLIDFDLVALLLTAVRRGRGEVAAVAFQDRDPVTALPWKIAVGLSTPGGG